MGISNENIVSINRFKMRLILPQASLDTYRTERTGFYLLFSFIFCQLKLIQRPQKKSLFRYAILLHLLSVTELENTPSTGVPIEIETF